MSSELSTPEQKVVKQHTAGEHEAAVAHRLAQSREAAHASSGTLARVLTIARNTFREAVRDRVLYNLVLFVLLLTGGAVFLGLVAVLPFIARSITGIQALTLSSTALLIVVGVLLDTIKQLEAQLLMRHYQGFIR